MSVVLSRDHVLVPVGVEVVTGVVDLHPLPALYDVLVVGRLLEEFLNEFLLRQTKLCPLLSQLGNLISVSTSTGSKLTSLWIDFSYSLFSWTSLVQKVAFFWGILSGVTCLM